jgi:hypothetical protein
MNRLAKALFRRPPNRLLQCARDLAGQPPSGLSAAALGTSKPGRLRRGLLGVLDDMRKEAAWNNVPGAAGLNPAVEKIDCDCRHIRWAEYGKLSTYGWEIDHAQERALGGSDDFSNLRARHWYGNRQAGGILAAEMSQ